MTAGIHSPDTKNYLIGKGVIILKPEGDLDYYPVGNVPTLEITPSVDKLDHFSSMEGTKTKDETIVLTKSGTIRMVMEEITAKNLSLLMLGDVADDGYGGAIVSLFSRASITSAFRFYATNDKGPRWFFDLPRVIWNPSGAFAPISDAYASMEATGEWTSQDGNFGTATLKPQAGTSVPENVLAPYIGPSTPAAGDTVEAFVGAWIGANAYTYIWKDTNVAIPGATNKTYVAQSGDVLTVQVTAINNVGQTVVTSAAVTVT